MKTLDEKVVSVLSKKRDRLRTKFEKQGGRGIELANEIDRLEMAIDVQLDPRAEVVWVFRNTSQGD